MYFQCFLFLSHWQAWVCPGAPAGLHEVHLPGVCGAAVAEFFPDLQSLKGQELTGVG